jgi:hypothetical protein
MHFVSLACILPAPSLPPSTFLILRDLIILIMSGEECTLCSQYLFFSVLCLLLSGLCFQIYVCYSQMSRDKVSQRHIKLDYCLELKLKFKLCF